MKPCNFSGVLPLLWNGEFLKGLIFIKTIPVENKNLITSPIRCLVRMGEKNADTVKILVHRYYGEHDLSDFAFTIEAVTEKGTLALQNLEKASESDDILGLLWVITPDFTSVSGKLKLTLRAVSQEGEVCILFEGGEIEVSGESNEGRIPADVADQILSQIEQALESAKSDIESAVNSAAQGFLDSFDPTAMVEQALPRNMVVSDDVRTLTVMSEEQFSSVDTPNNNTLYILY